MTKELRTVGDLINHLEKLGRDRALIADCEGNTYPVTTYDIALWDETSAGEDPTHPVAIFVRNWE